MIFLYCSSTFLRGAERLWDFLAFSLKVTLVARVVRRDRIVSSNRCEIATLVEHPIHLFKKPLDGREIASRANYVTTIVSCVVESGVAVQMRNVQLRIIGVYSKRSWNLVKWYCSNVLLGEQILSTRRLK